MEYIAEKSCLASKPELDLFENPPTSASVQDSIYIEHLPTSSLDDNSPIKFSVSGDSQYYTDLNASYLYLEVKVCKAAGSNLDADTAVGPINLLGHTLFQQVDVLLEDVLVSNASNLYHYRAIMEHLLGYSNETKTSQLTSTLYSKDTAGSMDDKDNANAGLVARRSYIERSKTLPLICRLHQDMFLQKRFLINGVGIKLKLTRNADKFLLMAADGSDFKLKITHAAFFVRKVTINKGIVLQHIQKMEKQLLPALYPIRKVEMKTYHIATGSLAWNEEGLFSGILPRRIVIGLVDGAAFDGAYHRNPFNFKHHNLKYCSLLIDGKMRPQTPLDSNFENNLSLRNYFTLFEATGKVFQDAGIDVNRREYEQGYSLAAWDLTTELEDTGCYHIIKKGDIRLELKFSRALTTPVNVVVYSEFDSCIKIDKDRKVLPPY